MDPLVFFKSLADDTRLKSLLLIEREGELCVCELMAALGQSQPTISRHLARLRRDGLLLDRRQGQWVFYRLHPELPDWACQVLTSSRRANGAFLQSCERALATMGDRPERDRICCA
ncbi:metalloregulator ArsR/SmtB family transcription factor [Marinimicrobium sp. C2-29]|uniref:metalloregulator ArsR/SmtB family transcription factor n=1 Tax=Marinimicrobium sp. C2-29 TaxID=3139825 RepID=UPI003138B551